MEKIKFEDGGVEFPIESIQPVSTHIMRIIFAGIMPDDYEYGNPITVYTQGGIVSTVLEGWNTIYYKDTENKTVYLSDDGSIYTEPEPQTEPDGEEPEPYEPTVEELQQYKISAMESTCQNTIYAGVDVTLDDDTEHFSLTIEDQLNLHTRQEEIDHGLQEIDYHADGEVSRYYYYTEMQEIIDTAMNFINYQATYCNELCLWIKALTDKDEIEAVYYGMEIPKNNRSAVLEDMLPIGDDETGMLPQEGTDDDEPDNDGGEPDNDDTNVGAGGELDFGDPADNYEPADEPDPADDGEGEE